MAPRNQYPGRGSVDGATDGFAITPADATDLVDVPRALWVGTGGDLSLAMASGIITLKAVPAGSLLPVRPLRVRATGTTAADIVGLL